jgi:hypothetical protein
LRSACEIAWADAIVEQHAIGQIGQEVVMREMAHTLLALLALRDVGKDLDVVDRRPTASRTTLTVSHFG